MLGNEGDLAIVGDFRVLGIDTRCLGVGTGLGNLLRTRAGFKSCDHLPLRGDASLRLDHRAFEANGIQHRQQLSFLDEVAFAHEHLRYATVRIESKLDLTDINVSVQYKLVDPAVSLALVPPHTGRNGANDDEREEDAQNVLVHQGKDDRLGMSTADSLPRKSGASYGAMADREARCDLSFAYPGPAFITSAAANRKPCARTKRGLPAPSSLPAKQLDGNGGRKPKRLAQV